MTMQEIYEHKYILEAKILDLVQVFEESVGMEVGTIRAHSNSKGHSKGHTEGIRVRLVGDKLMDSYTECDELDDLTDENLWIECDDCHGEPHRGPDDRYVDGCGQCGTRGVMPICFACEAPRPDETHPLCDSCHEIAEKEWRKR